MAKLTSFEGHILEVRGSHYGPTPGNLRITLGYSNASVMGSLEITVPDSTEARHFYIGQALRVTVESTEDEPPA